MVDAVDTIIQQLLSEFTTEVFREAWHGREREAISRYAFGVLLRYCQPGTVLHHPTQIAIEVTVPGVPGRNPKGRVNKDLIIWPEPGMTYWYAPGAVIPVPLAILEWKVWRRPRPQPQMSVHDLEWLTEFSRDRGAFVGYVVSLDLLARKYRLCVTRVYEGEVAASWLKL